MKSVVQFSAAILVGILLPDGALACSCASGDLEPREGIAELLKGVDVVALAEAKAVTPTRIIGKTGPPDGEITEFRISHTWKGAVTSSLKTRMVTDCCMCGVSFRKAETQVLFLIGPDTEGYYWTSSCIRAQMRRQVSQEAEVKILNELTNQTSRP